MTISKKQFGATLSVGLNCFLIAIKLVVAILSGSVSVFASAIDSFIDLVASLLAFGAIIISEEPPDADHPFGHGKFEDFAGLIEAILIMAGAFYIFWEAIPKLLSAHHLEVEPVAGLAVMGLALVLDFVVSRILFKIAKETESSALYADAHHLSTDVWSSIAVIIGLVLVKVTHNPIFDPIMAIVVAILISVVGYQIIRKVFAHLVDTALPAAEESKILGVIQEAMPEGERYQVQGLKTRRSGSHRLIVFNLLVNPLLTVEKAHYYCDQLEEAIERAFPNSLVTIHLEPDTKAEK
jgi:cation diffusion facilitator family transporter